MKNLDFQNLHQEFVRLGRMRHKLKNRMLFILPEIYASGIYKKFAGSIFEYAAIYGDISKTAVVKRLRLEKNLVGKPHLRKAIKLAGVNKVSLVAKLATKDNERQLAETVKVLSKSAVQVLSKEIRAKNGKVGAGAAVGAFGGLRAVPLKIKFELDEEMSFLFLKLKKKLGEHLSNKELMEKLLEIASEEVFGEEAGKSRVEGGSAKNVPGDSSAKVGRYVNVATKRIVLGRSGGKCEYNACNRPAVELHHSERFAEKRTHEGLVHLCREHHQIEHCLASDEGSLGWADFWWREMRKSVGRRGETAGRMRAKLNCGGT